MRGGVDGICRSAAHGDRNINVHQGSSHLPTSRLQPYYEPGARGCVKSATMSVLGSVTSSSLQGVV